MKFQTTNTFIELIVFLLNYENYWYKGLHFDNYKEVNNIRYFLFK